MDCISRACGSTRRSPARRPVRVMVTAAFTAALLSAGLACTSSSSGSSAANNNNPVVDTGPQNPIVKGVAIGASVSGGNSVHITGRNFAVGDKVFFGGKQAVSVDIVSKTEITAVIPPGAQVGEVTVLYKTKGNACTSGSHGYSCRSADASDLNGAAG